jgi:hypothetical protein
MGLNMLKSYVKRIISVILFISLSGCMSADPRESKYTISIEKFDWDFERASAFENDSLHISMVPTKNSSAVFDFIATKYAVEIGRAHV